jgi:hypothetical protein
LIKLARDEPYPYRFNKKKLQIEPYELINTTKNWVLGK